MSSLVNAVASIAVIPHILGFCGLHYTDNTTRVQLSEYTIYDNINNLENESDKVRTLGKIYYGSKQICISSEAKDNDKERMLYHEIGHVIDAQNNKTGKYSSTAELLKCFSAEKYFLQSFSKEYYFTDKPEEYFAECYSLYVLDPDRLQKHGEKTYNYLKSLIEERSKLSNDDVKKKIDALIEERKSSHMSKISLDGILPTK